MISCRKFGGDTNISLCCIKGNDDMPTDINISIIPTWFIDVKIKMYTRASFFKYIQKHITHIVSQW